MVYNLLIIEDSIPIRTAIKEIVKSSEFIVAQFFEASNVNEGLKILNEEIIDLVLFDFNTPDIDVFRFLEVMKKDETYKFIPIIIIITERSNLDVKRQLFLQSDIRMPGFKVLSPSDKVSFEIEKSDRGSRAINVLKI